MPSVTQVIELIVDYRERGETMTSKVPLKEKPASRGVCAMMNWDGVPAQLQDDETFVLPSAPNNLNVEMSSDAAFPRMRG